MAVPRWVAGAVAGAVTLTVSVALLRDDGPTRVDAGSIGETGSSVAPAGPGSAELLVRCGAANAVEVLTPVVEAQPDGVHVRVVESADGDVRVDVANVELADNLDTRVVSGAGSIDASGDSAVMAGVMPGRAVVRCDPGDGPRHFVGVAEDPTARSFHVIDPGAYFEGEPAPLECPGDSTRSMGHVDYGIAPDARPVPDPEPLREVVARDHPAEEFQLVGYRDAQARDVQIFRDDRLVQVEGYTRELGAWRLGSDVACGGRVVPGSPTTAAY